MTVQSDLTRTEGTGRLRRTVWRTTALGGLTLSASACADDKPLNTFEPRGPQAEALDTLMTPVWLIMAGVFVAVVFGTIIIAIRNRVNEDDYDLEDLPSQTHGNTVLELTWTAVPALILAALLIPIWNGVWRLEETNDRQAEVSQVMVIGQQWWWEFRYDADGDGFFRSRDEVLAELRAMAEGDGQIEGDPEVAEVLAVLEEYEDLDMEEWPLELSLDPDDVVTANELVIPTGRQIDLILTSRDVIHSFWIPRLNGKRDTVPGRWHTWSVEADEAGKFTGWCTEFCGLSHARMRMSTIALDESEFQAWWENQQTLADIPEPGTDAAAGRELFLNNCQRCHVIKDGETPAPAEVALVSRAAPDLTHFATRSTFAGGIYSVYAGGPGSATVADDDALPADIYNDLPALAAEDPDSTDDYRFNSAELKRWVNNAPERKDMAPDPNPETGLGRGMPAFDLTDEQLDQIVAYLATLD